MQSLDGTWDVRRLSGALPPLVGVRKVVAGRCGETRIGSLLAIPFDVDGLRLRYRGLLRGFVDELEPDEHGFRGRAIFAGHEYGRFVLRPQRKTSRARAT